MRRKLRLYSQRLRGPNGPRGIGQHCARKDDHIGAAIGEDFGGMSGLGDHADRSGGDARLVADRVGERDLIARMQGDFLLVRYAARGAVDQINVASRRQPSGKVQAIGSWPLSGKRTVRTKRSKESAIPFLARNSRKP